MLCNKGIRINLNKLYFLSSTFPPSNQIQIKEIKIFSIFSLFHLLPILLSSQFFIPYQTNSK